MSVLVLFDGAFCFADTFTVGIRNTNKTFEFKDSNGQSAGLLADVWKYWAEKNDHSVKFVSSDDKGLNELLRAGEIDLIANATPNGKLAVSEPYLTYDYYLISKKRSYLDSAEKIPLRIGILERDNFLESVLQSDVVLKSYQHYQALLDGMSTGEISFILVNDISLNYAVYGTELITLHYPEKPFYSHPVTAGSLVQNAELIEKVDSGMRRLSNPMLEQIKRRWNLSTIGFKLPWAFIGFAVFVLVAVVALVVTWLLKTKLEAQIKDQTHEIEKQKLALEKDIERRIVVEDKLKQAKLAADAMAEAKTQFLSTLTHELRTPLVGVLGMNELLLQTELNNSQKTLASTVQQSGETLLSLINDILDFSKLESGNFTLNPESGHVADILRQTTSMFVERAEQQGVNFCFDIKPEACRIVNVDILRLKQILMNLIDNAIKFSPQGRVDVRLDMDRQAGNVGLFIFEIEDTGVGMSPADLSVIFDSFRQVENTSKQFLGGTGLGLSIVRQLVELMDGDIAVDSRPDKGSLFRVKLPLPLVGQEEEKACDAGHHALVSPRPLVADNIKPPSIQTATERAVSRVLVADDYAVTCELIRSFLRDENIHLDEVASGKDVLAMVRMHDYDLILLDCNMPEMDGIETTRRLRQMGCDLPVVLMSAHVDSRVYEECMQAGMDDQLPKPFKRVDLNNILDKWLPDSRKIAHI